MNAHLFDHLPGGNPPEERLAPGAVLLRGFALTAEKRLLSALEAVTARAPFRRMTTPGGYQMSVAMTNCGSLGWVSDRSGYRYSAADPATREPWPEMPESFLELAARAAAQGGFHAFAPDVCLINRYEAGAKLSLHQDKDERDFGQPIVSVSLGISAVFLFGGLTRKEKTQRITLEHGDVVVWGGPARLVYHGIMPLTEGRHPLTGACRINLTFRRAG